MKTTKAPHPRTEGDARRAVKTGGLPHSRPIPLIGEPVGGAVDLIDFPALSAKGLAVLAKDIDSILGPGYRLQYDSWHRRDSNPSLVAGRCGCYAQHQASRAKWYVHPMPTISPLLSAGLNEEAASSGDFSEAYEAQK